MKQRKRIMILLAICMLSAAMTGCKSDFAASSYVEAVLNLQFQGDTQGARDYMEEPDSAALAQLYQQFIDDFVSGYITSGLNLGEMRTEQFAELTSTMFTTMRYDVGEAKKTGKQEYEVPVVIQPNDTFVKYQQFLQEDSEKITENIKNKKYKGSEEEIQNQVVREIAGNAYDLLEKAYEESSYGDKETVIVKVKAEKGEDYAIDEEDMDNLIVKILRLDEIGD